MSSEGNANDWQPSDTLPDAPDHWIAVQEVVLYRWLPYKEDSQQLKQGIKGRWQRHDGYGWVKAEETPTGPWRIADEDYE
jgi:hypothetical protein